jgi:RimJ/RimL family protein N-acetyltransferase
MQQSWRLDPDKLTFIICHSPFPSSTLTPKLEDAPSKMLGDVNLFLSEDEDSPGEEDEYQGSKAVIGEIEIMIAVPTARRKGLALSSLQAFLAYISGNLEAILEEYRVGSDERSERYLRYLRVKIDKDNVGSVGLFTKMGFEKVGCVNYFGEVEMRMGVEGMVGMEGRGEVVEYGS